MGKNKTLHSIFYVLIPILLGLSNPFALYLNNLGNTQFAEAARSVVVVLILTLIIYLSLLSRLRNQQIASIVSCLVIVLIFSFPNTSIVNPLAKFALPTFSFSTVLFFISAVLIFLIILIIWSVPRLISKFKLFGKVFSHVIFYTVICLVVIQVSTLLFKESKLQYVNEFQTLWKASAPGKDIHLSTASEKRDIYLIILDGYTSAGVMKEIFNYDVSWFIDELTRRGFVIIPEAKTNYGQTKTSMASLLNLNYLDQFPIPLDEEDQSGKPLRDMILNNRVMNSLKANGYEISRSKSNYFFLSEDRPITERILQNYYSTFEISLLKQTVFYPFFHRSLYDAARKSIEQSIDSIQQTNNQATFHFEHIYSPHPPFIYEKDGTPFIPDYIFEYFDAASLQSSTSYDYYYQRYPIQAEYISTRILGKIDQIINNSTVKPIIILMGDHGSGLTVNQYSLDQSNHYERMHILNALYLPGVDTQKIPSDITPVNTFRFIFNEYFDSNFPLLENRSIASSNQKPYEFFDVTDESNVNRP